MTAPTSTYASARDEILHSLAVTGYATRTSGARTSPQGKFWVLHISWTELKRIHSEHGEPGGLLELLPVDANDLAGYFVVTERLQSDRPIVFVETFDKSFQADDQFDHWEKAYQASIAEDAASVSVVAQLRHASGRWSVVAFYHGEYIHAETDDLANTDWRTGIYFPSADEAVGYAMHRAGFGVEATGVELVAA
jgi:hypothetical protein